MLYLRHNLIQYLRIHARKASDDGRHVDAELFTLAADRILELMLNIKLAPPDTEQYDKYGYYK